MKENGILTGSTESDALHPSDRALVPTKRFSADGQTDMPADFRKFEFKKQSHQSHVQEAKSPGRNRQLP